MITAFGRTCLSEQTFPKGKSVKSCYRVSINRWTFVTKFGCRGPPTFQMLYLSPKPILISRPVLPKIVFNYYLLSVSNKICGILISHLLFNDLCNSLNFTSWPAKPTKVFIIWPFLVEDISTKDSKPKTCVYMGIYVHISPLSWASVPPHQSYSILRTDMQCYMAETNTAL